MQLLKSNLQIFLDGHWWYLPVKNAKTQGAFNFELAPGKSTTIKCRLEPFNSNCQLPEGKYRYILYYFPGGALAVEFDLA